MEGRWPIESGRADRERRKGRRRMTSKYLELATVDKEAFPPHPLFCLTETFYRGWQKPVVSLLMQFSCRRGWSGLIFSPSHIFFLIGENFGAFGQFTNLSADSTSLAQVYEMGTRFRGKIARFHGFLASLFTQTGFRGSSGTWNIFSKRNSWESWLRLNSILNQGHSLIVEFEKWHESRRSIVE